MLKPQKIKKSRINKIWNNVIKPIHLNVKYVSNRFPHKPVLKFT